MKTFLECVKEASDKDFKHKDAYNSLYLTETQVKILKEAADIYASQSKENKHKTKN